MQDPADIKRVWALGAQCSFQEFHLSLGTCPGVSEKTLTVTWGREEALLCVEGRVESDLKSEVPSRLDLWSSITGIFGGLLSANL